MQSGNHMWNMGDGKTVGLAIRRAGSRETCQLWMYSTVQPKAVRNAEIDKPATSRCSNAKFTTIILPGALRLAFRSGSAVSGVLQLLLPCRMRQSEWKFLQQACDISFEANIHTQGTLSLECNCNARCVSSSRAQGS